MSPLKSETFNVHSIVTDLEHQVDIEPVESEVDGTEYYVLLRIDDVEYYLTPDDINPLVEGLKDVAGYVRTKNEQK